MAPNTPGVPKRPYNVATDPYEFPGAILYPGQKMGLERIAKKWFTSKDQLVSLGFSGGPTPIANLPAPYTGLTGWALGRVFGAHMNNHNVGNASTPATGLAAGLAPFDDVTLVHCVRWQDNDYAQLSHSDIAYPGGAGAGASAAWKIWSENGGHVSIAGILEAQMRHGMPPFQQSLNHGILPSLSPDVDTNMTPDPFSLMRGAFVLQRALANDLAFSVSPGGAPNAGSDPGNLPIPQLVTSKQICEMMTVAGAAGSGLAKKVGMLSPGKEADIVILDFDNINCQPMNNAYGTVVTMMDTRHVKHVMIAGKFVYWNGDLVGWDVDKVVDKAIRSRDNMLKRINGPAWGSDLAILQRTKNSFSQPVPAGLPHLLLLQWPERGSAATTPTGHKNSRHVKLETKRWWRSGSVPGRHLPSVTLESSVSVMTQHRPEASTRAEPPANAAAGARGDAGADDGGTAYLDRANHGQLLLEQGHFQQAFDVFQGILAGLPREPSYAHAAITERIGRCTLDAGKPAAAAAIFRQALGVTDKIAITDGVKGLRCMLQSSLGDAYRASGQLVEARKAYEAALELSKTFKDRRSSGRRSRPSRLRSLWPRGRSTRRLPVTALCSTCSKTPASASRWQLLTTTWAEHCRNLNVGRKPSNTQPRLRACAATLAIMSARRSHGHSLLRLARELDVPTRRGIITARRSMRPASQAIPFCCGTTLRHSRTTCAQTRTAPQKQWGSSRKPSAP